MPGHNDDEDEKTQMLIAGNRYGGQLTNCAWWSGDLEVRFYLLLRLQFWQPFDQKRIAPWRWSHMKLTEHPFQDLMMLVSGCGGGFWTTMEPNSHRLPVWPPWMSCCRCWCFLPWCTLYVMMSMVLLIRKNNMEIFNGISHEGGGGSRVPLWF